MEHFLTSVPWGPIAQAASSLCAVFGVLALWANRSGITMWFMNQSTLVGKIKEMGATIAMWQQRAVNAEIQIASWKGFADVGAAMRTDMGEITRQLHEVQTFSNKLAVRMNIALQYVAESDAYTVACVRALVNAHLTPPPDRPKPPAELYEDLELLSE